MNRLNCIENIYIGAAQPNFEAFQQDVNKLMKDIDAPINEDELSGDEDELFVG